MASTRFRLKGKNRDSYLDLVLAFPLASIRSEDHLDEAQRVMDRLLAKPRLDDGEETYLDALGDLVAAYEDVHHPIAAPSDAAMPRHRLEEKGIPQADLSRQASIPKSTISEILGGKKPFSKPLMRKLADFFHVPVSVLTGNL